MDITSPAFKENARARARRRAAAAGARPRPRRLHRQARARRSTALPEFEALRDSARDIKNHTLAHLDLYLEAYEEKVRAAGGQVHCAETAEEARDIDPRHLPRGRRADRHQGQVDDRRGDRPQRAPRGERHRAGRDRSRRIHHPAPPRAAEPHHRAGGASHQGAGRGGLPPRPHRPAAGPRPHRAGDAARPRRAACCASDSSPPMSASPAPISWSPRPAPRSSSPTRATATSRRSCRASTSCSPSIEKIVPTLEDVSQILRAAGALGDRPGHVGLHDLLDRAAPAGRSRRAGGVSRRPPRQRPLGDARHRVPGHAALHPLRRLHEPLPGLSGGRRPRLWLGLSRADGRGADAGADRRRQGRAPAQRLDLLRALRERSARCGSRCRS